MEWLQTHHYERLEVLVAQGVMMFDKPGIGPEDLVWIERVQYVYYVEMAHHLGDPTDWASFRIDLADALAAAFGLNRTPWAERRSTEDLRTRRRVLDTLDSIRFRHHPVTDWGGVVRRSLGDALEHPQRT